MFSSEPWLAKSDGFYNGVATQSLRFDDGSSAFLSRTPSSAGNRKTWTWSSWIKRSNLGANSIFEAGTASNNSLGLQFDDASKSLQFFVYNGSSVTVDVKTTQVFRDVSAWYHIVMGFDTTQATASNRVKLYVNGSQITDLATSTYPSQNTDFNINNTNTHQIGRSVFGSSNYIDGYLSEVNFIDGTALDPTSFGETKNGVWIPIKYTGSYGTNGFRLQFNQTGTGTASASTIGADTSGNTHHFTSSGIVASDCNMPDSPENNFAILNSLDKKSGITLSEGNLKRTDSVDAWESITAPFGMTSGKYYAEFVVTVNGSGSVRNFMVGVVKSGFNGNISDSRFWASFDGHSYHAQDGNKVINGSGSSVSYGATWNVDDIIGVALNLDDGEITFYKNNASQGVANTGLSGEYVFACATYHSGTQMFINCGQDSSFAGNETAQGNTDGNGIGDFYYAPPSGFLALCSANLPEPTISPNADTQAVNHFGILTYTANGNASRSIVSGASGIGGEIDFKPDWLWVKARNATYYHGLWDSSRTNKSALYSNATDDEDTSTAGTLGSLDTNGFTTPNVSGGGFINIGSTTYVAWNWKANGGTTSSNTDGDITSTVQANTTAGFSIVRWDGNSPAPTTQSIGHGLGNTPSLIIVKAYDAVSYASQNWVVWHKDFGANENLYLSLTNGKVTQANIFGGTSATLPNSNTFSVGYYGEVNYVNYDYIAYCFAEIEGYSKFGSYTGNGVTSGDGTFVFLGLRPAWIMIKNTSASAEWVMIDSVRSTFNEVDKILSAESTSTEADFVYANRNIDFLSNGFKIRSTAAGGTTALNTSGSTYVYMAFAENPFKYANAR